MKLHGELITRVVGDWDEFCPFDLLEVCDGRSGFSIVLGPLRGESENRFSIESPYGYRVFDESSLLSYLGEIAAGVYCCASSDFLKWACDAAAPLTISPYLKHYIIVSANGVLEYLGVSPPKNTTP